MLQSVGGLTELQVVRRVVVVATHRALDLLEVDPELAELVDDGFVGEVLDVLDVVIGLASASQLLLLAWLPRVDSFQDAQLPEV